MFQTKRTVEFSMCDNEGILFFSRIFELFHSAYEEYIVTSDLSSNYFDHNTFAIPLLKTEVEFKSPIRLHETIKIFIEVSGIKGSSFELTTHFLDLEDMQKAIVKSIHVFVEKDGFQKCEIPKEFRSMLDSN